MRIFSLVVMGMLGITLGGCASILHPGRQSVRVDSTPSGAEVLVGGTTVVTPALVPLKGRTEYTVLARKEGYKDTTTILGSDVRILSSVLGNILNLTGVVGMAVDFLATGSAFELEPSVHIVLPPERGAAADAHS